MQTRVISIIECCSNIDVGYVVAILSQLFIFPFFGIDIPLSSNLSIGLYFTIISFIRSLIIRRYFNGFQIKRIPEGRD